MKLFMDIAPVNSSYGKKYCGLFSFFRLMRMEVAVVGLLLEVWIDSSDDVQKSVFYLLGCFCVLQVAFVHLRRVLPWKKYWGCLCLGWE
ncbi:hypothetical protein XENTR_v10016770 [Xenopus tropicalis]|nr:hypothetical protein XENTR_v10016770 [Xenopus tropicalis]